MGGKWTFKIRGQGDAQRLFKFVARDAAGLSDAFSNYKQHDLIACRSKLGKVGKQPLTQR